MLDMVLAGAAWMLCAGVERRERRRLSDSWTIEESQVPTALTRHRSAWHRDAIESLLSREWVVRAREGRLHSEVGAWQP
jgi:hypothetical protein